MAISNYTPFRFVRSITSRCAPLAAIIGFSCLLTFIFILYQDTPGPGISQRLGWQSWDVVQLGEVATSNDATTSTGLEVGSGNSGNGGVPEGTDWWNVTSSQDTPVDSASLPLDVWAPLLPHDTGLSEIFVVRCLVNPNVAGDLCTPDTTPEKDSIKGTWVRMERNLNYENGYWSGYLHVYYRRTRRQDINLIDQIRLLPAHEEPFSSSDPTNPTQGWTKVPTSLRAGVYGAPPLYLWYHLGKTAGEMSSEEKNNVITELDFHFGSDEPWYGFEKLRPPTTIREEGKKENAYLVYRKGVKVPPRAPPLHFSSSGSFKIMQIADLHYSVSAGECRDVRPSMADACLNGSDNITTTLLGKMLDAERPDLVIFTGDQLNGQGTSWDPKSVLAKFSKAVAERGIAWTAVFGNHDAENTGMSGEGRREQMRLMKNLPYSVQEMEEGPKDVSGVGNYVVKVKSADASKTHLLTLYFLDSGAYSAGTYNFWGVFKPTAFDWMRQDQIDWFLQQSATINPIERPFTPDGAKDLGSLWDGERRGVEARDAQLQGTDQLTPNTRKLAKPNAMMFFHIPLPEAYSRPDVNPDTQRPYDVGLKGNEGKGSANGNDGFFEKGILKAMETDHVTDGVHEVKVVGNGHSHITENCRRVSGVWMCFGGGGSYSGYGKVGFDRRFRIYQIEDYGETIRTWKRTEQDNVVDDMVLAGRGAPRL